LVWNEQCGKKNPSTFQDRKREIGGEKGKALKAKRLAKRDRREGEGTKKSACWEIQKVSKSQSTKKLGGSKIHHREGVQGHRGVWEKVAGCKSKSPNSKENRRSR